MNRLPGVFILMVLSALMPGCQSVSILPPAEPKLPPLVLKVRGSEELIHVPPPVVIPEAVLLNVKMAWDSEGRGAGSYSVSLADGRKATLLTVPVQDSGKTWFCVYCVSVYRCDGSLEIEQQNGRLKGGTMPCPNTPMGWTVYEEDGKTLKTEVSSSVAQESGYGSVVFYERGKPVRFFQVSGDVADELK